MICEKCGKELPENETLCPCCNEEAAAAEPVEETVAPVEEPVTEEAAADIWAENDDLESGEPELVEIRLKRSKTRIIIGIVALVLAVALGVLSFLKPVAIIGQWRAEESIPISAEVTVQRETTMEFTLSGNLILTDHIINYEEIGYPEDQATMSNQFGYLFSQNHLLLTPVMQGEQQMPQEPITMYCSVIPGTFSYWMQDTSPRQVYDFDRVGWLYPSLYLWLVAGLLLILGVLLLAIPGKKCSFPSFDEAIEAWESNQLPSDMMDEPETEMEASEEVSQEAVAEEAPVTQETVELEETTDTPETTEE